jgi:hypothetical protein
MILSKIKIFLKIAFFFSVVGKMSRWQRAYPRTFAGPFEKDVPQFFLQALQHFVNRVGLTLF